MDIGNQQTTNGNIYNVTGDFILTATEKNIFQTLDDLIEDGKFLNSEISKIKSDKNSYNMKSFILIFFIALVYIGLLYISLNIFLTIPLVFIIFIYQYFYKLKIQEFDSAEKRISKQIDIHNEDFDRIDREARLITRRLTKINQDGLQEGVNEY